MQNRLVFLALTILLLAACAFFGVPPPFTPQAVPAATTFPPPAVTTLPPTETPIPPSVTPASATTFPEAANYQWVPVASGLDQPVDIQNAGDGSGRLFVIEQAGRIRIIQNGQLLGTPFLDITDRVGSRGSEQGLLGLAFHPHYAQDGQFFVNYTDLNGNTVIARFNVTGDPNAADPASETRILHVNQPFPNHNGGGLVFGPDGYLYIGLGDGGSGGDPFGNGQKLNTLLGKILRIDVDSAEPYAIPADNPFGNEIWAYGLRNPWRFSFDRVTGDLYTADVGQNKWEEIDFAAGDPPGLNYGWNYFEGQHRFSGEPPADVSFTPPAAEYSHSDGCAVTGGYVYRGRTLPEWLGIYLYGDYCSGKVWGLIHTPDENNGIRWQSQVLFETGANITSFGQDEAGEIYLADHGGTIYRLSR